MKIKSKAVTVNNTKNQQQHKPLVLKVPFTEMTITEVSENLCLGLWKVQKVAGLNQWKES